MTDLLADEADIRETVRRALMVLGDPPPLIVEQIMRLYFQQHAMMGNRRLADRWLEQYLRAMTAPR